MEWARPPRTFMNFHVFFAICSHRIQAFHCVTHPSSNQQRLKGFECIAKTMERIKPAVEMANNGNSNENQRQSQNKLTIKLTIVEKLFKKGSTFAKVRKKRRCD